MFGQTAFFQESYCISSYMSDFYTTIKFTWWSKCQQCSWKCNPVLCLEKDLVGLSQGAFWQLTSKMLLMQTVQILPNEFLELNLLKQ